MPRLEHSHDPQAIAARLSRGPKTNYLRDWIYGGIDGAITTFAVVTGVVGAELSVNVVLILGAANLFADGFSMAASNYTGTKAEADDADRLRHMEERHIRQVPEGEREEIRQIMARKGFKKQDLEHAVEVITSERSRWIDFMLAEEHGLASVTRSPIKAALSTFASFLLCGSVPLLPYMLGMQSAFAASIVGTGLVFAVIGSLKSLWSQASWWKSALETLGIGLGAATIAYLAGHYLRTLALS